MFTLANVSASEENRYSSEKQSSVCLIVIEGNCEVKVKEVAK